MDAITGSSRQMWNRIAGVRTGAFRVFQEEREEFWRHFRKDRIDSKPPLCFTSCLLFFVLAMAAGF
jgi:hypothetical protein